MNATLLITVADAGESSGRVLRQVPIRDERELAEAQAWLVESGPRWQSLSEGRLERRIVPAGGDR